MKIASLRTAVRHGVASAPALHGWFLVTAIAVIAMALPGGCATTPKGEQRVGGYELEASTTNRDALTASLYKVSADGTIAWGGGMDARDGNTTWSGRLNDEQCAEIERLLVDDGWAKGSKALKGSGEPRSMRSEVKVKGPGGSHTYRFVGESPALDRLLKTLDAASMARLDRFLKSLPEPGAQK